MAHERNDRGAAGVLNLGGALPVADADDPIGLQTNPRALSGLAKAFGSRRRP